MRTFCRSGSLFPVTPPAVRRDRVVHEDHAVAVLGVDRGVELAQRAFLVLPGLPSFFRKLCGVDFGVVFLVPELLCRRVALAERRLLLRDSLGSLAVHKWNQPRSEETR